MMKSRSQFDSLDELKEVVLKYNFYYNEHRIHQAIDNKNPKEYLDTIQKKYSFLVNELVNIYNPRGSGEPRQIAVFSDLCYNGSPLPRR